jgi:hypothetical protein
VESVTGFGQLTRPEPQELDEVAGHDERIDEGLTAVERERRDERAVDLGDERLPRKSGTSGELREPLEGRPVGRPGAAHRDRSALRGRPGDHEGNTAPPAHEAVPRQRPALRRPISSTRESEPASTARGPTSRRREMRTNASMRT